MKKLLGVSAIAMLAVCPMMAQAAGELRAAVSLDGSVQNPTTGEDAIMATAAYVKGAYSANFADISAVNAAVTTLNGNVSTDGSVLKAVKDNAATGTYNSSATYDANTIGAAIKSVAATAGTAVQSISTGTTNGTINVDNTEVSVAGLDTMAYESASDYYDKAGVEGAISTAIAGKADAATTLSGYGITDAYTSSQVDDAISAAIAGYATENGVEATIKAAKVAVPVYTSWGDTSSTTMSAAVIASTVDYVAE